jgi:hypothetical protein
MEAKSSLTVYTNRESVARQGFSKNHTANTAHSALPRLDQDGYKQEITLHFKNRGVPTVVQTKNQ